MTLENQSEENQSAEKKKEPTVVNHLDQGQFLAAVDWARGNSEACPQMTLKELAEQCAAAIDNTVTTHNMKSVLNHAKLSYKGLNGPRQPANKSMQNAISELRRKTKLQQEQIDELTVKLNSLQAWREAHGPLTPLAPNYPIPENPFYQPPGAVPSALPAPPQSPPQSPPQAPPQPPPQPPTVN